MAVWHVCQWGYWGENSDESCAEAEEDLENMDDDAHEHCGYYIFRAVEDEAKELIESIGITEP